MALRILVEPAKSFTGRSLGIQQMTNKKGEGRNDEKKKNQQAKMPPDLGLIFITDWRDREDMRRSPQKHRR